MRTSTKWCQSALAEMETSFTRPFNQSLSQSGKVAITLINLISFSIINDQNKQYNQNTKKKRTALIVTSGKTEKSGQQLGQRKTERKNQNNCLKT